MTYEEKLLEVFARFRGEGTDQATLEKVERACNEEVWQHLPYDVRSSWRLGLAFSDTHPGQLELQPRRLREDGATPAELEAALRGVLHKEEPPRGGIAGVSMSFGSTVPEQPRPRSEAHERNPVDVKFGAVSEQAAASAPSAAAPRQVPSGAQEIQAQASALGISLPPNSSLLGPFLEALAAASEYKARAEHAEQQLAELRSLLGKL